MSPEAIAAVNTVSYELETAAALRRALNTAGKDLEARSKAVAALQERIEALLAKCDLMNASLHKQDREARTAEERIEGLERANRALINENRQLRDECEALRATAADWQRRAQGRQLS